MILLFILSGSAGARADFLSQAQQLVSQLNPVYMAFGPLIDRAAQDGNGVLQDQLEHTRAIIGSELDHLKEIEQGVLSTANRDTSARIDQFFGNVQKTLTQAQSILTDVESKTNADLTARIAQMENLANVVDGLPWKIDPVVDKTGDNGLATYRSWSSATDVYLTGVGLKKEGIAPTATVKAEGNAKPQKATVVTSSMGMLHLQIPNSLIPDKPGAKKLFLTITFNAGRYWFGWPDYRDQSFDLDVCAPSRENYRVELVTFAKGEYWATRRVPHPGITDPTTNGIYVEGGGVVVCAKDANVDGWEPNPVGQYAGLEWQSGPPGSFDGPNQLVPHYPDVGCIKMTAGSTGHEKVVNVFVNQRKKRATLQCDKPSEDDSTARCYCSKDGAPVKQALSLHMGQSGQITLDTNEAIGVCQGDGLDNKPTLITQVRLVDSSGRVLDQDDIGAGQTLTMWGGALKIKRTNTGDYVTASLKASCSINAP
jgi:hypothetical protein